MWHMYVINDLHVAVFHVSRSMTLWNVSLYWDCVENSRKFDIRKVEPVSSLFDSRLKVSKNGFCVDSTSTNKNLEIYFCNLFFQILITYYGPEFLDWAYFELIKGQLKSSISEI